MKKKFILSAIAFVCMGLMFNSCDKVAKSLINPMDIPWSGFDDTVTVPIVTDTTLQGTISDGTFTYDLNKLIEDKSSNQLHLSNVDQFKITSCTLTILNPDVNNNFANFQLAEVAFSTSYNTNGVIMAEIDDNPDSYASYLSIPVNSTVDLKSYLPNSGPVTFNYIIGGKLRRATTHSLQVVVHVEYDLHVKP